MEYKLNKDKFIESNASEHEIKEESDDIYLNLKNDLLNYVNESKK